jgi:hypothetical protein
MMKNFLSILIILTLGIASCYQKETKSTYIENDSVIVPASNDYEDSMYRSKQSSLKIFYLYSFDTVEHSGFITLSEIDNLSEDEPAVPSKYLGNRPLNAVKYFKLDSTYRMRFLKRTSLKETDSVFIYDYIKDLLFSFEIKELDIVSHINGYQIEGDSILQESYMIGLEIKPEYLKGLNGWFTNTFVHIGKENPFIRGKMKAIVWDATSSPAFYNELELPSYVAYYSNYNPGKTYLYKRDSLEYYSRQMYIEKELKGYHITIRNKNTSKIIFNHAYINSEGTTIAPLNNVDVNFKGNYQWTGKLFKNKPDVILGFYSASFGCESIDFLDSSEPSVNILCDNRH